MLHLLKKMCCHSLYQNFNNIVNAFLPGFWYNSRSSRAGHLRRGSSWCYNGGSFNWSWRCSQIRQSPRRSSGSHDSWRYIVIVGAGINPRRRWGQAERSIRKHVVPVVHCCCICCNEMKRKSLHEVPLTHASVVPHLRSQSGQAFVGWTRTSPIHGWSPFHHAIGSFNLVACHKNFGGKDQVYHIKTFISASFGCHFRLLIVP